MAQPRGRHDEVDDFYYKTRNRFWERKQEFKNSNVIKSIAWRIELQLAGSNYVFFGLNNGDSLLHTEIGKKKETTRLDDVVTKEKGLQLAKSDARLQEA